MKEHCYSIMIPILEVCYLTLAYLSMKNEKVMIKNRAFTGLFSFKNSNVFSGGPHGKNFESPFKVLFPTGTCKCSFNSFGSNMLNSFSIVKLESERIKSLLYFTQTINFFLLNEHLNYQIGFCSYLSSFLEGNF